MKQLKRSYVRSARLLFALLLACMIAGSIYDFQISSFLYPGKESSFGQFFAAFGELPAFLALICAGVLLFRHRGLPEKRLERIVSDRRIRLDIRRHFPVGP